MFEVSKMLGQKDFSGYKVFTKLQHFEGSRVRAGRKLQAGGVNLYFNLPTSNDFDLDICCQGHYPE